MSRLELARQLCPDLPDAGARRIAQRATTFAEVFTVAAAPRLAEIESSADQDAVRALVDAAASGRLTRPAPSLEATVIAWAGGLVYARQADRALGILGVTRIQGDPDVRRWESLERLADPAAPRLADQVATGLTGGQRRDMAAAFLEEALLWPQIPRLTWPTTWRGCGPLTGSAATCPSPPATCPGLSASSWPPWRPFVQQHDRGPDPGFQSCRCPAGDGLGDQLLRKRPRRRLLADVR